MFPQKMPEITGTRVKKRIIKKHKAGEGSGDGDGEEEWKTEWREKNC